MRNVKLLSLVALAGLTLAAAQATKPAHDDPKLFKPYSLMTTLDVEMKQNIEARHDETLDAIRALKEQERADILEMMSEEQRAELEAVEAQMKADLKAYNDARRKKAADDDAEE